MNNKNGNPAGFFFLYEEVEISLNGVSKMHKEKFLREIAFQNPGQDAR